MGSDYSLEERGVSLMMTVSDALTLMISFAALIVAVISVSKDKK
ncbi:hypothetical protein BSM4216_0272 [Bacillus smithii]|nr:hypothetical protein BSM4216_0272 [Bacillus smithii]